MSLAVRLVAALAWLTWLGAHIALVFGLAKTPPRYRAISAFFVAPLAPYWGWHMQRRAQLWLIALLVYALAGTIARTM